MLLAVDHGMGDVTTPQLISATGAVAGSTLATLATTVLATSAIGGPVGIAIGAAVAGVTALLGAFGVGGGCGQSCVIASDNANQVEAAMKANLAQFQAGQISQADGLQTYDALWAHLEQVCQQIGGGAGENCIKDRQPGGKFDWTAWYRDPIANAQASSPADLLTGISTVDLWPLVGVAAAAWAISEAL